jgi:hypothetical protein
MKQVHPTYLSLVIATHREAEDCTAPPVVTGFGMFSVRKLDPDDWRFSLNASVVEATADEAALLIRLADALPIPVNGRPVPAAMTRSSRRSDVSTRIVPASMASARSGTRCAEREPQWPNARSSG